MKMNDLELLIRNKDIISRCDAIRAMYDLHPNGEEGVYHDLEGDDCCFAETISDAITVLEELPALNCDVQLADKEEWILVGNNHKLPDTARDVLVTCFAHKHWQVRSGYFMDGYWVINAYDKQWIDEFEVIAWKEMPKPWMKRKEQMTGELYDGEFENFPRDDTLDGVLSSNAYVSIKIVKEILDYVERLRNTGPGKKKSLDYLEKFIQKKVWEYTE